MVPITRSSVAVAAVLALLATAGGQYRVQRGDTLSSIADRFDTTVGALAESNAIADPDRIYVGQELMIPSATEGHVVAPGETLSSIARRYGTSVEAIAAANGIVDPHLIYVGTRLLLGPPGETPAPEPAPGGEAFHVVARGETLSSIARRHGTTVGRLVEINGIPDPDRIYPGTRLSLPGAWVCPVPGATFFNDWGFARSGGRFHEGNDLFAPLGSPVLAPVGGTVEQYEGSIGGLQFRLRGDDGNTYIGTHLDGFAASGRVAAGTVVGHVGTTGNAQGKRPHLHFEIIPPDSGPVNPYPTLVTACR